MVSIPPSSHTNASAASQQTAQSAEKTTGSAPSLLGSASTDEENVSQAAVINECDPRISQRECERKIQRDLGSAIRSKAKGCQFEPDWRLTHLAERTLHLSEVNGSTIVIVIDGRSYALQNSACEDRGNQSCSQWKPEAGRDYDATVTDRPEFLNGCLHRVLPAEREVCIGFGKIKEERLPYGFSRTPKYEVCYSVLATPVELAPERIQATTTTTSVPAQAPAGKPSTAPLSNDKYYTNIDGNRVQSPANSPGNVPAGATAVCRDGTYSFSQHRQGTCSHHGGVANWL